LVVSTLLEAVAAFSMLPGDASMVRYEFMKCRENLVQNVCVIPTRATT
jgi:hypothetical protein